MAPILRGMYQCTRCQHQFPRFETPGECPKCHVGVKVKCMECKFTDDARAVVRNYNRCRHCGASFEVQDGGGIVGAIGFVLIIALGTGVVMGWGAVRDWWLMRSIEPALVMVGTANGRQVVGIGTESGICTALPQDVTEVELRIPNKKDGTLPGREVKLARIPLCWIANDESLVAVAELSGEPTRKHSQLRVKVCIEREGKLTLESAMLNGRGPGLYLTDMREVRPGERGMCALGPVFDMSARCLGYAVRHSEHESAVVLDLRIE